MQAALPQGIVPFVFAKEYNPGGVKTYTKFDAEIYVLAKDEGGHQPASQTTGLKLMTYCIITTGHLMSWMLHFSLGSNSKAITSLKEQVIALQEFDHSVEILICVLCTIPCWSEKNVQVQQVIEVLGHIASIATKFPNKCVILFIAGLYY
ncbi:protein MOR1 [Artemisia annua]|uniref:Protein MOR1 n=1 Tax=Artemisia annua TaxID=35608 RepID=A0A2U1KV03_ARTAN|nr:protein MOR1 [Artemisia annua]